MSKAVAGAAYVPTDAQKGRQTLSSRKIAIAVVALAAVVAAAVFGTRRIAFSLSHEETDDAQVEGDISPVLPRVSGYVQRVLVADNERVNAGQALVEVDSRELDLKVAAADAALQNSLADKATAEASLVAARANASTAQANVQTALVRQRKAAADLRRDDSLFKTGAITESQFNDTREAADTTAAQLQSAHSDAAAAGAQIGVAAARVAATQTAAAEKASELDFARLQRSYATVTAPISGLVSRKSVEPGQLVEAGQTLLSVASEAGVWVVANFKETQLTRMKAGQEVEFEADSYPGVVFRGKVDSISGATGARFALLPPDNSTGNFVKVTQRIPVKIVLAQAPDAEHPLRPGMSVTAAVSVTP